MMEEKESAAFGFEMALGVLRSGGRVRRTGWNGKGMYLGLQLSDENSKMDLPYIYMSMVQGNYVPWVASQTDMLIDDWMIVTL